jgi:hypothetical protein
MKWLSSFLLSALLVGAPGLASAQVYVTRPAPVPVPAPAPSPGWRGAPMPPSPAPYARPVRPAVRPVPPSRFHVWVPGYWGVRGGARVWIGSAWMLPPYSGWVWVQPGWVWDGYQWIWQEGHWAPPAY